MSTATMPRADFFGNRLRSLRKDAGLTQQELAKRADLTQWAIAQIENGHRVPNFETVLALAAALGVSLSAFDPPADKAKRRRKGDE